MATTTVSEPIAKFNAKVSNISKNILNLKNDKKTPYRLCTISFVTTHGELKQSSAAIWEKNAPSVQEGGVYQVEARENEGKAYFTVAPFAQGAGLMDADEVKGLEVDSNKTAQMAAAAFTLRNATDYSI